jgi:excinuclease ABC subunit B
MEEAAKKLDFIQAAQYRDEMLRLQSLLEQKDNDSIKKG